MPRKAAEEFNRLGLTTSYSEIQGSADSKADIVGSKLFTANPYQWVQSVLQPALTAHGITSQMDMIQEVSRLFPVRTASQVITEMLLQGKALEGANSPFEKDKALQQSAMGQTQSYAELASKDYPTILKEFSAQLNTLLQVIGGPAMQMAIPVMKNLTDALTTMGQWAVAHPTGVKVVVDAIAGLAGALVLAGGAAVVAAAAMLAPGAAVAVGIAGLVGFVGTVAVLDWKDVKTVMTGLADAISSGVQYLVDKVKAAWNAVAGFFGSIGAGISSGVHDFRHWMGKGIGLHPGADGSWGSGSGSSGSWGKQGMNFVPPASTGSGSGSAGNVYMDGRKVGQIVSKHMAIAANGPLVGSAYVDPTRGMVPVDYSGG